MLAQSRRIHLEEPTEKSGEDDNLRIEDADEVGNGDGENVELSVRLTAKRSVIRRSNEQPKIIRINTGLAHDAEQARKTDLSLQTTASSAVARHSLKGGGGMSEFRTKTMNSGQWSIVDDHPATDSAPTPVQVDDIAFPARHSVEALSDYSQIGVVSSKRRITKSLSHQLCDRFIRPAEVRSKLHDTQINSDNSWNGDARRDNPKIALDLFNQLLDDSRR